MSREPSSPLMRGWDSYKEPPKPPAKPKPKRPPRVRVEPKKKPRPTQGYHEAKEAALTKALTTTVQLTAEERGLLRELRAVHPDAAGQALAKINAAKRQKEGR